MKYDYYKEIRITEDYEVYDFVSTGGKGDIVKRARFDFVESPDIYNLAFGDLTEDGGIDDYSISDNKDMAKILATIASTQILQSNYTYCLGIRPDKSLHNIPITPFSTA